MCANGLLEGLTDRDDFSWDEFCGVWGQDPADKGADTMIRMPGAGYSLYPFQRLAVTVGAAKLFRFGGIWLSDEMGLGKVSVDTTEFFFPPLNAFKLT